MCADKLIISSNNYCVFDEKRVYNKMMQRGDTGQVLGIIKEKVLDSPGGQQQQIRRRVSTALKGYHKIPEVDRVIHLSVDLEKLEASLQSYLQGDIMRINDPACMDRLLQIFNVMDRTTLLGQEYAALTTKFPLLKSDMFTHRIMRIVSLYDDSPQLSALFKVYQDMQTITDNMRSYTKDFRRRATIKQLRPLIQQGQTYRARETVNMMANISAMTNIFRDCCPSIHDWLRQQARKINGYHDRLNRMIPTLQQQIQERRSTIRD